MKAVREKFSNIPIKGAEIGVWKGDHALSILEQIPNIERLYLVDPYEAYADYPHYDSPARQGEDLQEVLTNARLVAMKKLLPFKDKITWVYKKFDYGQIPEPLDFVYIDANHTYPFVKHDIEVARSIVKPGGIISGDDYYNHSNFGVKMAVDWVREKERYVLHVMDSGWYFVKSPKIFYFNLNVGSGIERTGDTVLAMLNDLEVVNYKMQNPPCLTFPVLVEEKPDVIILNEFYARILKAIYYYKMVDPGCKFIFLNHCSDVLHAHPFDKEWHRTDPDGVVLINTLLWNYTDAIFNLNYNPTPFPDKLNVVQHYHPIEDKFAWTKPWSEREIDFMYFGFLATHKFSPEFVNELMKTDLQVVYYGPGMKRQPEDYEKLINDAVHKGNIVNEGFIPEEDLVSTLNNCRYMVVPHQAPEPFNLCIAQAIRCGVIVLAVHRGDWFKWAEGCYRRFDTVPALLSAMKSYIENSKTDERLMTLMDRASHASSVEMSQRTSFSEFKKLLFSEIGLWE